MNNIISLPARHSGTGPTTITSAATKRNFRAPAAVAEDIAFGLQVADPDILLAAIKRHRVEVDTFTSEDVPHCETHERMQEHGTPALRVVSVTFTGNPEVPDLLLALPANLFNAADSVELLMRILSGGRSYPDGSAISVILRDGREIVLLGGWDRSGEVAERATFIFGWRTDLPLVHPISTAIH